MGLALKVVSVADGDPGPAGGTGGVLRVIVRLMKILTALLAPEWLWRAEVLLELPLFPCGWLPGLLLAQKGVRWCTVRVC